LRLSDIRITGTNKLTVEDILPQLKSRKASAFAFIPFSALTGAALPVLHCFKRISERLNL